MRSSSRLRVLACLLGFLPLAAPAATQAPADVAALRREIAALKLDPDRAVTLRDVKLAAGLTHLQLDGVLLPATTVGGKTVEMVFLGKGRVTLEPPDEVEAGQLRLFTGKARLDEEFREAVFVVGMDAAVESLLGRGPGSRPGSPPDRATVSRGEALYESWKKKREREVLSIERGILLDALGDPGATGYFAAWFGGAPIGDFLYLVEPAAREQVTLGRFVPIDATDREKRRISKQIQREQKRGRLIGLEVEDLGDWDTWLSASLPGPDGRPAPGAPTFEPKRYTLDATLADGDLRLTGRARVDLFPVFPGARAAVF